MGTRTSVVSRALTAAIVTVVAGVVVGCAPPAAPPATTTTTLPSASCSGSKPTFLLSDPTARRGEVISASGTGTANTTYSIGFRPDDGSGVFVPSGLTVTSSPSGSFSTNLTVLGTLYNGDWYVVMRKVGCLAPVDEGRQIIGITG